MSDTASVTIVNGAPVVNIDKLKPNGNNVKLTWNMDTAGWVFTATGVVITNNTGQFSNPKLLANGKKFTWDDANSDAVLYNYTINVQQSEQGRKTLSLDPQIQNGGAAVDE